MDRNARLSRMSSHLDARLCILFAHNARALVREHEEYYQYFEYSSAANGEEYFSAAYQVASRLHFMLKETLVEIDDSPQNYLHLFSSP